MRLIHQGDGKGKGDAVRKGFAAATGDVLFILDADLTVPPEDLPKFYAAIAEGKAEFVNGSRLVYPMEGEAMRFLNSLGNKFFGLALSAILEQRLKDTLCGTKVLFRRDYERIAANRGFFGDFDPFGDFDLLFGAAKQNLKIVELPIRYRARTYGETKIIALQGRRDPRPHDLARVPQVQGPILIAMPLSLKLPPPGVLVPNNAVDPLPYYYRPLLGKLFAARLNTGLRLLDGHYARLLEIGYGSGLLMPTLASACDELYGLDLEREPSGLRERLGRLRVTPRALVQANARAMPFGDDFFDAVVAFSIFEHLRAPELSPALGRGGARARARAAASSSAAPRCIALMNAAFAAIGFSGIEDHHFSTIADVVDAAGPWFTVERHAALPGVMRALPLGWAPYTTVLLARRCP